MAEKKRSALWPYVLLGALALPMSYTLSDGVGMYAVKRKWIDFDTFMSVWGPLPEVFGDRLVDGYEAWWCELAYEHGGSD